MRLSIRRVSCAGRLGRIACTLLRIVLTGQHMSSMNQNVVLRQAIEQLCPTSSDFEAFLLDYFPNIQQRAKADPDHIARVNRLLSEVAPSEIVKALIFHEKALASTSQRPSIGEQRNRTGKYQGFCIRCHIGIALDRAKPLCRPCYGVWEEFENVHYTERYCHQCGRAERTNFARPLCNGCYGIQNAQFR